MNKTLIQRHNFPLHIANIMHMNHGAIMKLYNLYPKHNYNSALFLTLSPYSDPLYTVPNLYEMS